MKGGSGRRRRYLESPDERILASGPTVALGVEAGRFVHAAGWRILAEKNGSLARFHVNREVGNAYVLYAVEPR